MILKALTINILILNINDTQENKLEFLLGTSDSIWRNVFIE